MEAAESIATTSIRAADAGLGVAGVEDGHLWRLGGGALLGEDAAEAIAQVGNSTALNLFGTSFKPFFGPFFRPFSKLLFEMALSKRSSYI